MNQRDIPFEQGALVVASSAAPSAGAPAIIDIPDKHRFKIIGVSVQLVTDATVANRTVYLSLVLGATVYGIWSSTTDQTANTTYDYAFCPINQRNDSVIAESPLIFVVNIPPNMLVDDDVILSIDAANLQATDQFGLPRMYVQRWLEL